MDDTVSIAELAQKTDFYSGSDLKNLVVSAALARAKETFVKELMPSVDSAQIGETFSKLADVAEKKPKERNKTKQAEYPSLNVDHFDTAFAEVPPSLSQETTSLVELRKWNDKFGEGARRQKAARWGF